MKTLKHVIVVLIAALFLTQLQALANDVKKPILPLNLSVRNIPLLWETMVDPTVEVDQIGSPKAAISVEKAIKKRAARIQSLNGGELRLELKRQAKDIMRVLGFMEKSRRDLSRASGKKIDLIRQLGRVSNRISEMAIEDKGTYDYLNLVCRYFGGGNKADIIPELIRIREDLPDVLKTRVDLISGIYLTQSSYTAKQGIMDLTKLSGKGKGGRNIIMVQDLALARALSGLSHRGERVQKPNPGYIKILKNGLNRARRLSLPVRSQVSNFAFSVWRFANPKTGLKSIPFGIRHLDNLTDAAIKERQILGMAAKGNLKYPADTYKSMAIAYRGKPVALKFANRFLDLEMAKYRKTRLAQRYFNAIVEMENFGKQSKSDASKKFVASLSQRKRNLVMGHLEFAVSKKSTKSIRREALRLATVELNSMPASQKKAPMKALMAKVYMLEKQPHKAESLYTQLASQKKVGVKTLLQLAKSQRTLMSWPEKPPFKKLPAASIPSRKKLLDTYKKISSQISAKGAGKELFWRVHGQVVLLHLSLGDRRAAIGVWTKAIKEESSHPLAREASGTLITTVYRDKSWDVLAQLLNQAEQVKNKPVHRGKLVNVGAMWRETSFRLASRAKEKGNQKEALKLFKRYVAREKAAKDPRAAEVYWALAKIYQDKRDFKSAIRVFQDYLSTKRPKAARKKFLYGGHQMAFISKMDDETAAFGLVFLKEFPKEKEAVKVREQLIGVMKNQKAGRELARLSASKAQDPRVKPKERAEAASVALRIYEKRKRVGKANQMASLLLKIAPRHANYVADAVSYFARSAARKGDVKQLASLKDRLKPFGSKSKEIAEVRGFIQFNQAVTSIPKKLVRAGSDPKAALARIDAIHNKVSKSLEVICEGTLNPFCAPAKFRLAMFTEKSITAIEEIPIDGNLSQAAVNGFNILRDQKVSKLKKTLKQSIGVAERLAKEGSTSSNWKKRILAGSDRYRGTGMIAQPY